MKKKDMINIIKEKEKRLWKSLNDKENTNHILKTEASEKSFRRALTKWAVIKELMEELEIESAR